MVYSIDKEGRLNIPDGLIELSVGFSTKKVVLAEESACRFRLVPVGDIPADAKVISGPISFDEKHRVFLPKPFRDKYPSSVEIYVMGRKLYIEFARVLAHGEKAQRE